MWNQKNFKLIAFFIALMAMSPAFAKNIFVSPNGSDENSGTINFPLKTISEAHKMALDIFEKGKDSKVTIWLEDGIYPQTEPLVFTPLISKSKISQLIFKARKGTTPIVSGGVEMLGWKKNPEGLWETSLPATLVGMTDFRELFIQGKRAVRARFPNEGYLRVKQAGADRRTNFFFEEGDFPIPEITKDLELVFLHDWSISRIAVKEINTLNNQLFTVDSIGAKSPEFFHIDNWEPTPRYFLENAREFLDADYEWIFLKEEKKFLLKLPEGVNPAEQKIFVPVSQGLISILGDENTPVRNISFEGITFQFSKWEIPQKGYCGIQACHFDPRPSKTGWAVVPPAISAIWAENLSFSGCSFKNFGGSGVWLGTGTKNSTILNSEFRDISGNGIMIGEGQDRNVNGESWWKSAPEQVALGNTIQNCILTEVGAQFYGAVGIWVGLTAETTIQRNDIFNLPYTGISVGWMWSPAPTPARQNTISGNHIYDIMKILSDGGGIYMLGLQPGSKILNNRIHDVEVNAGKAESNGMFLDEGITDVLVEGNLVYNIAKSPLRFHRATINLVQNNYFFCKDGNPPIRYNTTKEEDIRLLDNRVFSEGETDYQNELKQAIRDWEIQRKTIK